MIVIKTKAESRQYDASKPLEEQLQGATEVLVDYGDSDPIEPFMAGLERMVDEGRVLGFEVKVYRLNGAFQAAAARRRAEQLVRQSVVNQLAGLLAEGHRRLDCMMGETAAMCGARRK